MAFIKTTKVVTGTTYGDVLDRFAKLQDVKGLTGDKLCFARSKNLMHLRTFEKANSHTARIPVTKELEAYQKEFSKLRENYLLKDGEGKAILHGESPTVDIANPELVAKTIELKEKYKAAIQEREDDIKAYNEFMLEVVPEADLPKVHIVKMDDVANLSQEQVEAVIWFVEE